MRSTKQRRASRCQRDRSGTPPGPEGMRVRRESAGGHEREARKRLRGGERAGERDRQDTKATRLNDPRMGGKSTREGAASETNPVSLPHRSKQPRPESRSHRMRSGERYRTCTDGDEDEEKSDTENVWTMRRRRLEAEDKTRSMGR
jgi:hypothetical protein